MKAIVYHKYGSPDRLALEEVGVLPREGRFRAAMNDALKGRPASRSGLDPGSDQHAELD